MKPNHHSNRSVTVVSPESERLDVGDLTTTSGTDLLPFYRGGDLDFRRWTSLHVVKTSVK